MANGKRALVTGATSGIGAAIVRALRAEGYRVLAMGRRADRLEALAVETGAVPLAADVRNLDSCRETVLTFAPDILINNAGVGHGIDGLATASADMVSNTVETNVTAPLMLTNMVLPAMRAAGRGHIVNIGSIAGLHSGVSAIYGATKGAVHLMSQNLRYELRGTGIRVTELCPGRVTTEFYAAAEGDRARLDMMGKTRIRELAPEDIAAAAVYSLGAPEHVNVATIEILPTDQVVAGPPVAAPRDQ